MAKWKTQKAHWEEFDVNEIEETDDWVDDQLDNDEISAEEAGLWRGARDWRELAWKGYT